MINKLPQLCEEKYKPLHLYDLIERLKSMNQLEKSYTKETICFRFQQRLASQKYFQEQVLNYTILYVNLVNILDKCFICIFDLN